MLSLRTSSAGLQKSRDAGGFPLNAASDAADCDVRIGVAQDAPPNGGHGRSQASLQPELDSSASLSRSPAPPLYLCSFRDAEGILNVDAQIADGALDLRVSE